MSFEINKAWCYNAGIREEVHDMCGIEIIDIFILAKFCSSRKEAKRMIKQGILKCNNVTIDSDDYLFLKIDEGIWGIIRKSNLRKIILKLRNNESEL